MRRRLTLILLLLLIPIGLLAWMRLRTIRPAPATELSTRTQLVGATMGGGWSIRLGRPTETGTADRITESVQAILDRIDGEMSTWKPASNLSRFNAHNDTDWIGVPAELVDVISLSQQISTETDGAFDVTVGPLVNLWGFGPGGRSKGGTGHRVPSDLEIRAAKERVGFQHLLVREDPPALRKLRPDLYVDLSAIAQGAAADRVADHLNAIGVKDYLINICGEMRARGVSPTGAPWRVGIQTPTPDTYRVLRGVELRDIALATSGDYQIYFEEAGVRYCHEIDPRTGRPIQNHLATVCVAHASAGYADAMATGLMVLGPEAGYALCISKGIAACFIVRQADRFDVRATPAFLAMFLPDAVPAGASR